MKAGVNLWFTKEDGLAYDLGTAFGEYFEYLGMNIPRPGPATYVGYAFIVDCNNGERFARVLAGSLSRKKPERRG